MVQEQLDARADVAEPHSPAQATGGLDWLCVGEITGAFIVKRYQRGYRWGKEEVTELLNDLLQSEGAPYSLQPVVVKASDGEWELIDGQQRLTTLYLLMRFLEAEGLADASPAYTISYETRPESTAFLLTLEPVASRRNIDFHHFYEARECIRAWFDELGAAQEAAEKILQYLRQSVRVLWYVASGVDSTTLFRRLNVGRIPLNNAELIKALLLARSSRPNEWAAQWDSIERDLRDPDVWAFLTSAPADDYPTRISLLLDAMAAGWKQRKRSQFYTFERLRSEIETNGPDAVWDRLIELHSLALGWYEDRDLFHRIGYLIETGDEIGELVELALASETKTAFATVIHERIRKRLNLTATGVEKLNYEAHHQACFRALLLMNVETVRRLENSSERYSFRAHRAEGWSLEHIHAQQAEKLETVEQWQEWLRLHREVLASEPSAFDESERRRLVAKIDAAYKEIDGARFREISEQVIQLFTREDAAAENARYSVHSISNLALLSSGANSALGNSVFEVKRRQILKLDRKGAYIPVCTRQVFLKYYTEDGASQFHFWSPQDRKSYVAAMIHPKEGKLTPYLQPSEAR